MVTAGAMTMLGDVIAQSAEQKSAAELERWEGDRQWSFDYVRMASFFTFGAAYTGAFQHWWFETLLETIPAPPPESGFGAQFTSAAAKTALCQFGTIPLVYLPLFFALTGVLRGLSLEACWQRAEQLYLPVYTRNISFWIPAQMIQFLFVDPAYMVTYCCFAGLLWGVVLSQIAGRLPQAPLNAAQGEAGASALPDLLPKKALADVKVGLESR